MQYALIKDTKVVNVIVAETDFIAAIQADYNHIEPLDTLLEQGLGVGMGWSYVNGEFVAPVLPPVEVISPKRHITQLAFMERFTDAEAIAIDLASIGQTPEAAAMRRYQSKVQAAKFIDLDSESTRTGVMALETLGLIAAGRALTILDSLVLESERA